jgi:hypothetical protein
MIVQDRHWRLGARRLDLLPRSLVVAGVLAAAACIELSRGWPLLSLRTWWAEDGGAWYATAYNHGGLHGLLRPQSGYFQTFPRLVGAVEVHLPIAWGPMASGAVAILADLLPVAYLLSRRLERAAPFGVRAAIGLATLALPDALEGMGNITNVQWHLALLALAVILADPARRRAARMVDVAALVISGLTGPFVLFLAPIAAWRWGLRRGLELAVLGGCAALQAVTLLAAHGQRAPAGRLGAPLELARIVGGRVFAAGTLGEHGSIWLLTSPAWSGWLPPAVALAGLAVCVYAGWRGTSELRALLVFAALLLGSALLSPLQSGWWSILVTPPNGARYFYVPTLAWLAVLLWLALTCRPRPVRALAGAAIACLVVLGMSQDWTGPHGVAPVAYQAALARFEAAPAGSEVVLPIEPPPSIMCLAKRGPAASPSARSIAVSRCEREPGAFAP